MPQIQTSPTPRPEIRRRRRPVRSTSGNGATFAVALVLVGTVVGLAFGLQTNDYNIWGAFIVGPILLLLALPLALSCARVEGDPRLVPFIMGAAFAKIIGGAVARYAMVYVLYDSGDARLYDERGLALAAQFRDGDFSGIGKLTSTEFIETLTGFVYTVTGPTQLGGFMVYSFFAFVGTYLAYRAFRLGYPDGDARRYRWLIFFFPTMLFWPSSVGKDAFMVLCLGACMYGVAAVVQGRLTGLIVLGLGVWGSVVVRPHVTLIVLVGFAVALPVSLLRGTNGEVEDRATRHRLTGLVAVVAVVLALGAVVSAAEDRFKLDELNPESAQGVFEEVNRTTGQGGSSFTAPNVNSPPGLIAAAVTVIARPFPWEAKNIQSLLTAAEGLLLVLMLVLAARRLRSLPALLLREPYVAFAAVYCVGFIVAFVNVENFGILARQRVQMLPALLVLVSLAPVENRRFESETVVSASSDAGHASH
ncbi:hypothetical protein [Actinospongicola halichondriae]|uniref:hypothetical protein n=1 Tax=Actinospongicola halichondriae TaxID=3236844 RepID=UPI003D379EB9